MTSLIAVGQVLAFLGAIALVVCTLAATLLFVMLKRMTWARVSSMLALGTIAVYAAALFVVGAMSEDELLPAGRAKPFCEIDCHVVFDVLDSYPNHDPSGLIVVVRESFDAHSIGPRRGDAPMTPGSRRFALVDADGRRYQPTEQRTIDSIPLFSEIRPGEERRAQLTFALPPGVAPLGLLVEEESPVSPLLIGHERSPLHGKVLLPLPGATRVGIKQL